MNKRRVLVLGASGMAGHMIFHELRAGGAYAVWGTGHSQVPENALIPLDVRERSALVRILDEVRPNVIINAVGALIRESVRDPANAIRLNSVLPHDLAALADDSGARVVHISTDCVFSGRQGGYSEDAFRDADDTYGRSKALGELLRPPHLTLRTSIVGPERRSDGSGLLAWFLRQEGTVRGYTRALWSGITTLELARGVQRAIESDLEGLFHVTNGQPISKYDLLHLFHGTFPNRVSDIVADDTLVTDKSLKKSEIFDFEVLSYSAMVAELASHPLAKKVTT